MQQRVTLLLSVALIAVLSASAAAGPPNGSPAPDFALEDVNGVSHSLSDYAGKVILIFFWEST
jgi:hypothetical protein